MIENTDLNLIYNADDFNKESFDSYIINFEIISNEIKDFCGEIIGSINSAKYLVYSIRKLNQQNQTETVNMYLNMLIKENNVINKIKNGLRK